MDTEYFDGLTDQLAHALLPTGEIKRFVSQHNVLIGQHAEAVVRQFVVNVVSPIRVSTGAVIYPGKDEKKKPKQVDAICWSPNPFPAIFEADGFALVPRMSSIGVLEIKSSAYDGVGAAIQEVLDLETRLTVGPADLSERKISAVMGVVVRSGANIGDKRLRAQIDAGRTVILIRDEEGEETIDTRAVCRLANFLNGLRLRARNFEGIVHVNEQHL